MDPFMGAKARVVCSVNKDTNPKVNAVICLSDRMFVGKS